MRKTPNHSPFVAIPAAVAVLLGGTACDAIKNNHPSETSAPVVDNMPHPSCNVTAKALGQRKFSFNVNGHDDDIPGSYSRTGLVFEYGDGTTADSTTHTYKSAGYFTVHAAIKLDVEEHAREIPMDVQRSHEIGCPPLTVDVP
ncbi:MAG TPA: hypothetical protein VJR27_03700 [Candidatus Saccharimonadales bacterium]|nr:hypothetical protein [Candidatus Saccharimonadales bacterium]